MLSLHIAYFCRPFFNILNPVIKTVA